MESPRGEHPPGLSPAAKLRPELWSPGRGRWLFPSCHGYSRPPVLRHLGTGFQRVHSASSGRGDGPVTETTTAPLRLAGPHPPLPWPHRFRAWPSAQGHFLRGRLPRDASLGSRWQREPEEAGTPTSSAHRRAGMCGEHMTTRGHPGGLAQGSGLQRHSTGQSSWGDFQ